MKTTKKLSRPLRILNSWTCWGRRKTRWTVWWKSTAELEVPRVRTGLRCLCVCISVGLRLMGIRSLLATFRMVMRLASRVSLWRLRVVNMHTVIWRVRMVFTVWCVFRHSMLKVSEWQVLPACSSRHLLTILSRCMSTRQRWAGTCSEVEELADRT